MGTATATSPKLIKRLDGEPIIALDIYADLVDAVNWRC